MKTQMISLGAKNAKNQLSISDLAIITKVLDGLKLDGDEVILDVGCGDGDVERRYFNYKGNYVTAIDTDKTNLSLAKCKIDNNRISFRRADFFEVYDHFDLILLINVCFCMDERLPQRLSDLLADDGKFVILDTETANNAFILGFLTPCFKIETINLENFLLIVGKKL